VRYTTMVFSHELMEAHVPVHLPDLEIHPTEATKVPMGKMDLLEDVSFPIKNWIMFPP